tara:strand:+ start:693 stop:1067 length:375 start_codon:yes stop_codon:yes gene_type:complete
MNKKERPILKNLIKEGTSELEYFQNITIRPIIKMQHDLLILSLSNYLKKRKIIIEGLSENQIKDKINAIINKDIPYRNICLGFIIGHFSSKEYTYYINHSSEINKRIIKIIQKRFLDSLNEILN